MRLSLSLALPGGPLAVRFLIVGLGGTGGYVFYHLARLLASLPERENFQILLADGDVVEEKNLVRQNFAPGDLGRNKAQCLARRYGNVYGMSIPFYPRYVEDRDTLAALLEDGFTGFTPDLPVLVGCVDNNRTRQLFHHLFETWKRVLIYVDSGNDEWSGQVILGAKGSGKEVLPPVGYYYPDILDDRESLFPSEESCSDRAVSSPQNIATNVLAGTLVFGILNQLFAGEGIATYGATFNARTMQTRALYLDDLAGALPERFPTPFCLRE